MAITINGSGPVAGVTTLGMTSGTITGLSAGGLPDATITQAEIATPVAGTGPAFSAYKASGNQSVANGTWTKLQFNTEYFDTNNNFDNVTNYRFTPSVAGYYFIQGSVNYNPATSNAGFVAIYKNGNQTTIGNNAAFAASVYTVMNCSGMIYMNGMTDYLECYCYQASGSSLTALAYQFSGALVRAA